MSDSSVCISASSWINVSPPRHIPPSSAHPLTAPNTATVPDLVSYREEPVNLRHAGGCDDTRPCTSAVMVWLVDTCFTSVGCVPLSLGNAADTMLPST